MEPPPHYVLLLSHCIMFIALCLYYLILIIFILSLWTIFIWRLYRWGNWRTGTARNLSVDNKVARNKNSKLQEIKLVRNQDFKFSSQSSLTLDNVAFPSFSIIFKILKVTVNLITNSKTIFYLQIPKEFLFLYIRISTVYMKEWKQ